MWRAHRHGQLGLGDRHSRLTPTRMGTEEAFDGLRVRMAACGDYHTMAVTEEGTL